MLNHSAKLTSLMFMIGRRMRDDMRQYGKENAVSWLHFETLRYVREAGTPLMRDVAEHFSITPPAVTLLVEGLVANQMLRRIVDAKDRRAVRIGLTPKGKETLVRGMRYRKRKITAMFSALNARERTELIRILEKLANL